jgi:hypothetical protein
LTIYRFTEYREPMFTYPGLPAAVGRPTEARRESAGLRHRFLNATGAFLLGLVVLIGALTATAGIVILLLILGSSAGAAGGCGGG